MKKIITKSLIVVFLVSAVSFASVQNDEWTELLEESSASEALLVPDQVCGDTSRFYFVGCRRPGECRNSCPSQNGISLNDPTGEICDANDYREGLICCCG